MLRARQVQAAAILSGRISDAITLDDDALARLDELFPGPGGTAPEAYAW